MAVGEWFMRDVEHLCTHEQLLGSVPVGIASLEGGVLHYTNEAFATLHGSTVNDLLGQRWTSYVSPIYHAAIQPVISQPTDAGLSWSGMLSISCSLRGERRLYCMIKPGVHGTVTVTLQEAEVGYGPGATAIEELRALRDVTSTSNHGYWRWTMDTDEVEISRLFSELLGYASSSASVGIRTTNWFFTIMHPDDLRVAEAGYERYLAGQQPFWEAEVRLRSADSRWIRTSVRGCFVRWADDGKPMDMAGTFTNLEEAYSARQALDNLERILRTIAATPAIGQADDVSTKQLTTLLHMTFDRIDVSSGGLVSLKRHDDDTYECDVLRCIDRDDTPVFEPTYRTSAHGIEHVVTGDVVTLRPEDPTYGLVAELVRSSSTADVLHVIPLRTERRTVGCIVAQGSDHQPSALTQNPVGSLLLSTIARLLEMRQHRGNLDAVERRNEGLSEELDRLRRSRESSARATDDLLAGVSHELRQPLSAILGTTESLLEGVYGTLNPAPAARIMDVHECATHLLSLINDMLDVSMARVGSLSIVRSSTDVVSVVSSAVTMLRPLADRKNIAIRVAAHPTEPIMVDLDAQRIRQVVINLVANAIKFTPEWGEVIIDVRGRMFDTEVCISVADNGIGIASDQLPMLLEPYAQADASAATIQQGSGLGLPIVAYIIDAHDGILEVQSTPGQGSTFTVCLPWKCVPSGAQLEPQPEKRRTSNGSVIVIDRNLMFRSQAKMLLSDSGYCAETVAEGLQDVQGQDVRRDSVIVVGVQRIDADLKRAVRRIMASVQPNQLRPRIIVMPAIATQVDIEDLRAGGVCDVLPKGVAKQLLVTAVAAALRDRSSDLGSNDDSNPDT
jgi:signal transduction histidine kinase/PAS domain-containing protein